MDHKAVENEELLLELQTRIVSQVTEEISIPLAAAIVGIRVLQEYWDKMDAETLANRFDRILASLQRVSDVVRSLPDQDFVHLEDRFAEYDLVTLCLDIVQTLDVRDEYRGRIRFNCESSTIMMHMNVESLRYMVCQLIGFMLKYAPIAGVVDLELSADDQHVILKFIDQGDIVPFSDSLLSTNYSICGDLKLQRKTDRSKGLIHNCIELHGGSISFDRIADSGSVIMITLLRYHRRSPE